jgi:hypothetical protein
MNTKRARAIEAVKILNDFMADAVIGTRSFGLFDKLANGLDLSEGTKVGLARMCYFHIILLLAKWAEFYDKYRSVIPADCIDECRALSKRTKDLGILSFRNKYVGHVWNKDTQRPLSSKDTAAYLEQITGRNWGAFLRWINNSEDNQYPRTVVSVISHLRDRLRAEYHINREPFEDT